MPQASERKAEIIKQFAKHEKDTGSPEVQIAL
jgi:ribosomal protein S15P/S13E